MVDLLQCMLVSKLLLASPAAKTDITITLTNSDGFGLGDYITLGDEILRVKANPTTNTLQVALEVNLLLLQTLVKLVRLFRRSRFFQWSYADTPFFVHLHIHLNT